MSAYVRVYTQLVPATIQIVKKLAWHTPLGLLPFVLSERVLPNMDVLYSQVVVKFIKLS